MKRSFLAIIILLIGVPFLLPLQVKNHLTSPYNVSANHRTRIDIQSMFDISNRTTNSPFDDDFESDTLDAKWHWLREDITHWSISSSPGFLRITTQYGDLYEVMNDARNVLLQTYSAYSFEIRTRIVMVPETNFQQGGLLIYADDDNYVRLTYAYINGPQFEFAKEVNGEFQPIQVPAPTGNSFHLRIVKLGQDYIGYYSSDGSNWIEIGQQNNINITTSQIGLIAFNADEPILETPADFDYFYVIPSNSSLTLYDDFNDPLYDGTYNPDLWYYSGDSFFNASQVEGVMVFNNSTAPTQGDGTLIMRQPEQRSLQQLRQFEAQLMVSSDHVGGYAFVKIQIVANNIAGQNWWTQCRLGSWESGNQPEFICDVYTFDEYGFYVEYATTPINLYYDTWYTARIEADPENADLSFYLDDVYVGGHTPNDASELIAASNLEPRVGIWNNDAGVYATRYVDNVMITDGMLPIVYDISGIVTEANTNEPIPGVMISVGELYTAITNAGGGFTLSGLSTGTYTITPSKSGYLFIPSSRTVDMPPDATGQDFVGVYWGGRPTPFLDLPFDYGDSMFGFIMAMSNYNEGGRIGSWFDHNYPNYAENDGTGIWLFNAIYDDEEDKIYDNGLYSYDGYYYDGHDGLDFSYEDPDPDDEIFNTPLEIYPAAPGEVIDVCDTCTTGFGNYVLLYHDVDVGNGYFTRYAHLASVREEIIQKKASQDYVDVDEVLGIMGSTGIITGPHLHFGVYRDNGDGEWNQEYDKRVDPFEYRLDTADPWVEDKLGPPSYNLWINSATNQVTFSGDLGATVTDRSETMSATIPPNYFIGESVVELSPEPAAKPHFSLRSLGLSFWLRILQGIIVDTSTTNFDVSSVGQVNADPLSLSVNYTEDQIQHLVESDLALYQWDDVDRTWDQLPSIVDMDGNIVSALSQTVGVFDLQAPLTCPDDVQEPNDTFNLAHELDMNDGGTKQLFDIPEDEDWFTVQAYSGWKYTLETLNLAPSVDTKLEVYNKDLSIFLQDNDSGGGEGTSMLTWYAPTSGIYFIRVSQDTGSTNGCSASYDISIQGEGRIYIPMVVK